MTTPRTLISCGIAVLTCQLIPVHAATILAPYSNDFEGPSPAADFTLSSSSTASPAGWTVTDDAAAGSDTVLRNSLRGSVDSETYISAAVDFSNFGGSNPVADFVLTTDLTITSLSTFSGSGLKWNRVGITALAESSTLQNSGYFAALSLSNSTGATAPTSNQFGIYTSTAQSGNPLVTANFSNVWALNVRYTLTLTGTLQNGGNDLLLNLQVTDGVNTASASHLATAFTEKGEFAGLSISDSRSVAAVEFDDFSFQAVPQPGVASLLAAAASMMLFMRRRPFGRHAS